MKRISLLLFLIPAFLFSCDKIDEANTVDFNVTLSVDIPVVVAEPVALLEKSTEADIPFSQSKTTSLSEISEISNYLNKIKSIDINKLQVVFTNLEADEEIKSINVSVTGVGTIATITNITASNNTHTPSIDNAKLMQVATILMSSKSITVTVSGTVNTAPMNFVVNSDFYCYIEAKAI